MLKGLDQDRVEARNEVKSGLDRETESVRRCYKGVWKLRDYDEVVKRWLVDAR